MEDEYFQSHQKLSFIGSSGQQKLRQAGVLVIGAGGLGCPCLQYLAGCGIGTIGIADFDTVDLSNLHRQFLYNTNDVGKMKTAVAIERLSAYNPFVHFIEHQLFIDDYNVLELIKQYDVIVDCTDNFLVRYLINDACVYLNKPLIYGAIHQAEGHLTVFNYHQSATLRCLFPEAHADEIIQSCADIGAYNIITGLIGLMMANETVKIILDNPDVLKEKLCYVDSLKNSTMQISYKPLNGSRQISIDRFKNKKGLSEISVNDLQQKIKNGNDILLIDVREADERSIFNIGGENIPLQQLLNSSLPENYQQKEIIIYCQTGERSSRAVMHLIGQGFSYARSLKGGIKLWRTLLTQ